MTDSTALAVWSFVAGLFVGIALFGVAAWFDVPQRTCVPVDAVDYNGFLNAWTAADGHVVLLADDEDNFDWCNPERTNP